HTMWRRPFLFLAAGTMIGMDETPEPADWQLIVRRRWLPIAIGSLVLAGGLAAALWLWFVPYPPFSEAIRQDASVKLYYASPLPPGFRLDKASVNFSGGVLAFYYTFGGGQLAVTEQAKPSGFDFGQLQGDMKFQTRYGAAVIRTGDSHTAASLV